MTVFGEKELREVVETWPEFKDLELKRIEETTVEWRLGYVHIHKIFTYFRYGYGVEYSDTSRFRKVGFDFGDLGIKGWAAVFREFDRSPAMDAPHEYFAGWVREEDEAKLNEWIAFLNAHISKLIKSKKNEKKF